MPKKKKAGGKKKEKGKAGEAQSPGDSAAIEPEGIAQNTKEFYLLQIQDLEERLGRYRRQCDLLKQQNGDMREKVENGEQDMRGIISTISDDNEKLAKQVVVGSEQVEGLRQMMEEEKEEAEKQLAAVKQKNQEEKEQLLSELRSVQRQNELMEEFREEKQALSDRMLELEDTVERQKREFEDSLYDVEKKKVISQERLKKEMVERVKEASHEFKKASEKQMSETTKRAIRENISISNQLVRISAKNEELLSQNDSLKQKLHRTVLDRSGLEKSCHEVTRKNISQLRNIELLMKKLERTESQLRELHSEYGHFEQIQIDYTDLEQMNSDLASDARSSYQIIAELREQLERACDLKDSTLAENARLLHILVQAASLVDSALRPSSDPAESFSRREDFMVSLLEILEKAKLHSSKVREVSQISKQKSSPPPIFSLPSRRPDSSKYRPGSLGFISSQPDQHILPPI